MLEKAKQVVLYILTPITLLFGLIFYLFTKNNTLQQKLAQERANKELDKVSDKLAEASKDADEKQKELDQRVADWKRLMDEYTKRNGGRNLPD